MEIRRSVMGRPNLSVKGTVVGGSGKETRAGTSRRALPFQCASFEAREARTFLPAPSGRVSLRSRRDSVRPLGLRAFIAEHAENIRGVYGKSYPLPPQPGYARRSGWAETQFIIELAVLEKVSRVFGRRQSLWDGRVGQRRHDLVSRRVGVKPVFSQFALEQALPVDHESEVVEIEAVGARGDVSFQPVIQLENLLRRALGIHILRLRRVVVYGQHRREHDADIIGVGKFGHGSVVRFDIFEAHGAGVSSDVIGAGESDQNLGMKINHVLPEADEHLRRGLASDAAVDVGLAGKVFLKMPDVGDRVAEEYGAVLAGRRRLEGGVGLAIAGEFAEVVAKGGSFGGAVLPFFSPSPPWPSSRPKPSRAWWGVRVWVDCWARVARGRRMAIAQVAR